MSTLIPLYGALWIRYQWVPLCPIFNSVTITTGSGMLTSFSVVFNTLVITHPFTIFTRDPARYTPGNSSFRSTNPSAVVDPVSAGNLTIVSDRPARSSEFVSLFPEELLLSDLVLVTPAYVKDRVLLW